jgi:flagellar biogenesis protein FliO
MSPELTYVLQSLGTVAVFGGVAWGAMAGLRRIGVQPARGPIEVLARAPLDGRRAIYLVRVGKRRVLVVGAGESGLTRLGSTTTDELEVAEGALDAVRPSRSFRDALSKVLRPVRGDEKGER